MEKSFLDEIVSKRNKIFLKKINPNETIKTPSNNDNNGEYITIDDSNFNKSLNKIFNLNDVIKNNLEYLNKSNTKIHEKIGKLNQLENINNENISKNTKAFVYLGIFVLLSQIIITGINDYLMLRIFNS